MPEHRPPQDSPDPDNIIPPAISLAEAERFLLSLPPGVMLKLDAHPLIIQSFLLAAELHLHQKRKSGEPYIIHPVAVAKALGDLTKDVDPEMVCAALLHDVIEDCGITKAELAQKTTLEIAEMVDGLTKVDGKDGHSDEQRTFEKFERFARKDPRIAFIKFSDILHNLGSIGALSEQRQARYRANALAKYVPYARAMHQGRIADMLEKRAEKTG